MLQQQNGTLVREFAEPYRGPDRTVYAVRVYGREREDGTWVGWIEFSNPLVTRFTTDRETTQSKFDLIRAEEMQQVAKMRKQTMYIKRKKEDGM